LIPLRVPVRPAPAHGLSEGGEWQAVCRSRFTPLCGCGHEVKSGQKSAPQLSGIANRTNPGRAYPNKPERPPEPPCDWIPTPSTIEATPEGFPTRGRVPRSDGRQAHSDGNPGP
jgi:hypothetical protein